jgi:hypothetical protein
MRVGAPANAQSDEKRYEKAPGDFRRGKSRGKARARADVMNVMAAVTESRVSLRLFAR